MRYKNTFHSISVVCCVILFFYISINYYQANNVIVRSRNYTETILDMTRLKIKFETWKYNFSYSGASKLEDLVMEAGGNPVRSIIVTTWRSGSSFLGDLLNAMPSNFYHYEPLIEYKSKRVKDQPEVDKAIHRIKNMLKCDYTDMEDYFKFGKFDMAYGFFKFNTRLWDVCQFQKELCVDPTFSANYCKLFPFQNMKVVRLGLRHFETVLEDKELNVKLVLLIRDPRGVMLSRTRTYFCKEPDCADPALLCEDMVNDYMAANQLLQKYPDRLMVLRFEELALNINSTRNKLFEFLLLKQNDLIDEFLASHTNRHAGNAFSTFRVSHDVAFKWVSSSDYSYVAQLQEVCKDAMDLWGFELADNVTHMKSQEFYPLKPYSMKFTHQDSRI